MTRHSSPAGRHGRTAQPGPSLFDDPPAPAADLGHPAAANGHPVADHANGYPGGHWNDHPADPWDDHTQLWDEPTGVGGLTHPAFAGAAAPTRAATSRRAAQRARRRRARRRRLVFSVSMLLVLVLAGGAWVLSGRLFSSGGPPDYRGSGTGTVTIKVAPGDDATVIGATLARQGVVESQQAFVAAAKADSRSLSIEPGAYALHKQMSAKAALAMLLDPSARVSLRMTIPEGSTEATILADLAKTLSAPLTQVKAAAANLASLGIPAGYGNPVSAEGFLFPQTYEFDPGTTPAQALQQMVVQFIDADRQAGLTQKAASVGLNPYQVLIVASMIEGEAKFPQDRGKIARVIYNRLAQGMPLGIDATSVYEARLAGKDPSSINYNIETPYNTRLTPGKLPPTPISNPGEASMAAAVSPTPGNWTYYVVSDAQGHHTFTNDPAEFNRLVALCHANHYGC